MDAAAGPVDRSFVVRVLVASLPSCPPTGCAQLWSSIDANCKPARGACIQAGASVGCKNNLSSHIAGEPACDSLAITHSVVASCATSTNDSNPESRLDEAVPRS